MKRGKPILTVAALAGIGLLSACVNLEPGPDRTRFFILGAGGAGSGEVPASGGGIYVRRPELPAYLKSDKMSYRAASGELKFLGHRWAEPLDQGIARALAEALAARTGEVSAGFYPWAQAPGEASSLRVQIHEFGADAEGRVVLDAAWVLELPGAGTAPVRGNFRLQTEDWKPGDPAGMVAAMNGLIERLAAKIAGK